MEHKSTFIFGDLQGCFDTFQRLLEKINYNPQYHRLGFVGDLINRGPQSLETLRFISQLDDPIVVLGNHDLHCLAIGYGVVRQDEPTLEALLSASDKWTLLDWLRQQPLFFWDSSDNYCVVHAGIPPQWSLAEVARQANEVSCLLQGHDPKAILKAMYQPQSPYAYTVNALTRMRFCTVEGELDLENKTASSTNPNFKPWFDWYSGPCDVLFGHWAALRGNCLQKHVYALDYGCVWGGELAVMHVSDKKIIKTSS